MRSISGVAVLLPAKNEQQLIGAALRSIRAAARQVPGLVVHTVVACDTCTDGTAQRALEAGAHVVAGRFGTPAAARAAAVTYATRLLAEHPQDEQWLVTTDADCVVPDRWLASHVLWADSGYDAVAGAISIADWARYPAARTRYEQLLARRRRSDGTHDGVYGANLGVRASVLSLVGGIPQVGVGEDRALWDAVGRHRRARVSPSTPAVLTSARPDGRAVGGLSDLLTRLATEPAPAGAAR